MTHNDHHDFILGDAYDPVALCLDKLMSLSGKKVSKTFGGTAADNAFYGGVSYDSYKKEKNFRTFEYPCHKYIAYMSKPEVVYNRFTHRPTVSDKARRAYFSWITSDTGPWQRFKNRLETHLPEGVPEKDKPEWIYQNGWVWSDLSAPSNLQHNFLVAQRMAAEWPKWISKWYKWQHEGYNKGLCLLFQDVFHPCTGMRDGDDRQIFKVNDSSQYDFPFDVCTSSEEAVRNFLVGKLDESVLNKPYKEYRTYTPVNRIFGDNQCGKDFYNEKKTYIDVLYDLYCDRLGLTSEESEKLWQPKAGFSRFEPRRYWTVRETEILEIIHLEEERLSDSSSSTESKPTLLSV